MHFICITWILTKKESCNVFKDVAVTEKNDVMPINKCKKCEVEKNHRATTHVLLFEWWLLHSKCQQRSAVCKKYKTILCQKRWKCVALCFVVIKSVLTDEENAPSGQKHPLMFVEENLHSLSECEIVISHSSAIGVTIPNYKLNENVHWKKIIATWRLTESLGTDLPTHVPLFVWWFSHSMVRM